MHELGVVFQVIKMVEEVCEENDLTEISSVTLNLSRIFLPPELFASSFFLCAFFNTT